MKLEARLVWLVALPAEARPICNLFGFIRCSQPAPFPTYRSACGRELLVVSGLGRNLAAAATMYAHSELGGGAHVAWLNVGIAGHANHPIGSVWMVNKVIEAGTGARYYPQSVLRHRLSSATLTTVDRPKGAMEDDSLYDMEGSAVFHLASRLSSSELVALVKIVSDHGVDQSAFPTKIQVAEWMTSHGSVLRKIADGMLSLSAEEAKRLAPIELDFSCIDLHFTVAQQHQLRTIYRRWTALGLDGSPLDTLGQFQSAASALKGLRRTLDEQTVDWTKGE